MIPGSNLLTTAFMVIGTQTVSYYKYLSRTVNEIGMEVTTYDDSIDIVGSFQPVPRSMYEQYGLELSKDFAIFYVPLDGLMINRDVSGDQFEYAGRRWQCESDTDWFAMDGWKGILACAITS